MKIFRPGFGRGLCGFLKALFWTPALGLLWMASLHFLVLMNRLENPRDHLSVAGERFLPEGSLVALSALGGLLALRALLGYRRHRYRVSATELEVETGILWKRTRTLPLARIHQIEISSGPLMRLLGLRDLQVVAGAGPHAPRVTLYGLRDVEEVRRFLLERRESLREAMTAGDPVPGGIPLDVAIGRLAAAVDRLERRLPPG